MVAASIAAIVWFVLRRREVERMQSAPRERAVTRGPMRAVGPGRSRAVTPPEAWLREEAEPASAPGTRVDGCPECQAYREAGWEVCRQCGQPLWQPAGVGR